MRAAAETAVRWRAGVTSFHMALQMAARTVRAEVALSTLLLVWFWVRHYLPLGPHYFRLWLFSWLFGKVIPLHFLNILFRPALFGVSSSSCATRFTTTPFRSGSGTTQLGGRSGEQSGQQFADYLLMPVLLALAVAAYVFGGGGGRR